MTLHLAEFDEQNHELPIAPGTYAAALQRQRSKAHMRDIMREKLCIHEPPISDEVEEGSMEQAPEVFTRVASGDPNFKAVDLGTGIACCPFTGKQLY